MATISAKIRATGELFQATGEVSEGLDHDAQPPIDDMRRYTGYLFVGSSIRDTEQPIRFTGLKYTMYAGSELDEVPYGYRVLMVVMPEQEAD
jgi:hypothetical protein